jgi:hypothetical protein
MRAVTELALSLVASTETGARTATAAAKPKVKKAKKAEPVLDLAALLGSGELALRDERKSPATVKAYTTGVL